MKKTRIEWVRNPDGSAGYTWNPTTGCTKGCDYCYARRVAETRLRGRFGYPADEPFRPTVHPERFAEPLQVRTPSSIFVDSMGDLFDPAIPDIAIARVWWVMGQCVGLLDPTRYRGHTFMILTKQPERMASWLKGWATPETRREWTENLYGPGKGEVYDWESGTKYWPNALPGVWLGVTCENQQAANERIPLLLATPAAVRFVSVEPILGVVDLDLFMPRYDHRPTWPLQRLIHPDMGDKPILQERGLDWVIVGAQTGPGAKPPQEQWIWDILGQCRDAKVPIFLKDNLRPYYKGGHPWSPEQGPLTQQWPEGGVSA